MICINTRRFANHEELAAISKNLMFLSSQNGSDLEPRGFILEPTGGQFAENGIDLQALVCSAPEFVQFVDLGYPASSPSEVEPVGDLVSAFASLT